MIHICAWCKRITQPDDDQGPGETHGICLSCMRQQCGDWMTLCSRMDWSTDLVEPADLAPLAPRLAGVI